MTEHDQDHHIGTTIVGGRPARGREAPDISRGIEVLIKKAAVDSSFRSLLLEKRADAAREIDLVLSPAENALLNTVTAAQLEQIIANTTVPKEHRRVFLGKVAALMLAVLGVQLEGCSVSLGVRPAYTKGIAPDLPEPKLSCDPDDVRRDPDGKGLDFEVLVKGTGSMLLSVRSSHPLSDGDIEVSFRSEKRKGKREIVYQSGWIPIARNKEVRLRVEGHDGRTDWLVLRLLNGHVRPGDTLREDLLRLPKQPYEPGEYTVGNCLVYRIVKFRKVWTA